MRNSTQVVFRGYKIARKQGNSCRRGRRFHRKGECSNVHRSPVTHERSELPNSVLHVIQPCGVALGRVRSSSASQRTRQDEGHVDRHTQGISLGSPLCEWEGLNLFPRSLWQETAGFQRSSTPIIFNVGTGGNKKFDLERRLSRPRSARAVGIS